MDRTAVDCIAYLRFSGQEVPTTLWDYARSLRITRVFLLDTLTPFEDRPETGRLSGEAMSRSIREKLDEVYRELDCIPISIKKMSITRRVDTILSHVADS